MKPLPLIVVLSIFVVFAFSVKKEPLKQSPIQGNCCESAWKGNVAIEDLPAGRNTYILPEENFINGGYAQLRQRFGSYYRWWTSLDLSIPCTAEISADNTKLEWYCESDMAINQNESDMGATLTGDKDTASINCITYYRPPYSVFRYGRKLLTDVPEVVNDPSDWAKYSIEITGNTMKFSKNDVVKKELKDKQTLGILKKITLHFKGSGKVGWVKLYEKGKLVMQEDFEVPGKSSVKWQ
jgi:hypothetical protein